MVKGVFYLGLRQYMNTFQTQWGKEMELQLIY